jgi:ribosomal protein L10
MKIDGKRPKNTLFDIAFEQYKKRILEAKEKGEEIFFLWDEESGIPYEVSKKRYESYKEFMNLLKLKLPDGKKVGSIVFFGTCGNLKSNGL